MTKKRRKPERDNMDKFEIKVSHNDMLIHYKDEVMINMTTNGYQYVTMQIPKTVIDELIIKLLQAKAKLK